MKTAVWQYVSGLARSIYGLRWLVRRWWLKHWETATLTIMGLLVLGVMVLCLLVGFSDVMR